MLRKVVEAAPGGRRLRSHRLRRYGNACCVPCRGGYASATLRFPRRGGDVQVVYLDPQPAHSRARNTLSMNASGEVIWHERYDDKPPNARLLGSISVYLCRFS